MNTLQVGDRVQICTNEELEKRWGSTNTVPGCWTTNMGAFLPGLTAEIEYIDGNGGLTLVKWRNPRSGKPWTEGSRGCCINISMVKRTRKSDKKLTTLEESLMSFYRKPTNNDPTQYMEVICGEKHYKRSYRCFPNASSDCADDLNTYDFDEMILSTSIPKSTNRLTDEFIDTILRPFKDSFSIDINVKSNSVELHIEKPLDNFSAYKLYLLTTVWRAVYVYAPHVVDVYEMLKNTYPSINRLYLALISFSCVNMSYYGLESLYQTGGSAYPSEKFNSAALVAATLNAVVYQAPSANSAVFMTGALGQRLNNTCLKIAQGHGVEAGNPVTNYFHRKEEWKTLYKRYKNNLYLADESKVKEQEQNFIALLMDETKKTYGFI